MSRGRERCVCEREMERESQSGVGWGRVVEE